MDYVEMIKDSELVLGFQELVSDSDPVVVKRTVKVFTNSYFHSLRLLGCGEISDEKFVDCWLSVKGVVDKLLSMVKKCNNDGILVQILRFTESAVMAHLTFDVSSYPLVFQRGREVVKTGLRALKDIVTTPYVGGVAYIYAVRSLISIACVRPDLWEPVTELLKKQLVSLPPTLFDHNVRSLNKTLQRNLFRLLRRADTPQLKSKLIEMMVSVGVPRKMVVPWAPLAGLDSKKRAIDSLDDSDSPLNNRASTPPEKALRLSGSSEEAKPTSRASVDNKADRPSEEMKEAVNNNFVVSEPISIHKNPPHSPQTAKIFESDPSSQHIPFTSTAENAGVTKPENNTSKTLVASNNQPMDFSESNDHNTEVNSSSSIDIKINISDPSSSCKSNENFAKTPNSLNSSTLELGALKNLAFLTSLIPKASPEKQPPKKEANSKFLSEIYNTLSFETVCSLVLQHITRFPDEKPPNFNESVEKHGKFVSDSDTMKNRLSKMLHEYFIESGIQSFPEIIKENTIINFKPVENNQKNVTCPTPNFAETGIQSFPKVFNENPINLTPTENEKNVKFPPNSTPQLSQTVDTDLRQLYSKHLDPKHEERDISQTSFSTKDMDIRTELQRPKGDVDMRLLPAPTSRDPRITTTDDPSTATTAPLSSNCLLLNSKGDVDHRISMQVNQEEKNFSDNDKNTKKSWASIKTKTCDNLNTSAKSSSIKSVSQDTDLRLNVPQKNKTPAQNTKSDDKRPPALDLKGFRLREDIDSRLPIRRNSQISTSLKSESHPILDRKIDNLNLNNTPPLKNTDSQPPANRDPRTQRINPELFRNRDPRKNEYRSPRTFENRNPRIENRSPSIIEFREPRTLENSVPRTVENRDLRLLESRAPRTIESRLARTIENRDSRSHPSHLNPAPFMPPNLRTPVVIPNQVPRHTLAPLPMMAGNVFPRRIPRPPGAIIDHRPRLPPAMAINSLNVIREQLVRTRVLPSFMKM